MYRSLFLLVWGCWLASSVHAQSGTVIGTVVERNGGPLPGVNVIIEGTTRGAATNIAGYFEINNVAAGPQRVLATAIGYHAEAASILVRAADTVRVNLVLIPQTLSTDEVVITAARREQLLQSVPLSLSVLPAEALEARPIISLDDALRYVSGVQMADNQVNIRGSSGFSYNTGSRVLLLLDGMSLLSPDSESISYESLPLAQIERVEVVKGPGSALYGSSALGGVINVITKDFPSKPELDIRMFGGVYLPVRYQSWRRTWNDADIPRPLGGANVTYAHQLSDQFGYWLNVAHRYDAGHLNFKEERSTDIYAKFRWRLSPSLHLTTLSGWTRRKADAFLYWNGLDDPLNPGNLGFADNTSNDSPNGTNDNLTDRVMLHLGVSHVVHPSFFYSVKGRIFSALIRPLDEKKEPRSVDDGTLGFRYGGEVQLNWSPSSDQFLTAGFSGDALATQSSFFQEADAPPLIRSQPEAGAFAQWEQMLGSSLNLVAGVRYDVYQIDAGNTEQKVSPKLNVAYSLSERLALRGSYGQGFRVPSLAERFINNQSFFPIVLNLDLQPELSEGYEIGVRGNTTISSWGIVTLDVAAFSTNYRRLVEPTFVPEERAFQFVNLIRARIKGLEAEVAFTSFNDRLQIHAGYTLLDAVDRETNRALVFRSKHLLKAGISSQLVGPLELGIDARFASEFERVDTDFARFVPDADVVSPIHVVDVRIAAHVSRYRIALFVRNIFDYYYVERPAILAPPRSLLFQITSSF